MLHPQETFQKYWNPWRKIVLSIEAKHRTPSNTANVASYKQSYCCLDSTKPVVVAQYSIGYSSDANLVGKPATEVGDPFMTIIPPVNQYINNYTVTSLEGAAGPFAYWYINLAIAAQFFDNTANSRQQSMVNGTVASPIDGYIPFYCSNNEICGYGAQVEVNRGTTMRGLTMDFWCPIMHTNSRILMDYRWVLSSPPFQVCKSHVYQRQL